MTKKEKNSIYNSDFSNQFIKKYFELVDKVESLFQEADNNSERAAAGYDEGWYAGEANAYSNLLNILKDAEKYIASTNESAKGNGRKDMVFYIATKETFADGWGLLRHSKENFVKEISAMVDNCVANGGTYFDVSIDADASCFASTDSKETEKK